MQLDVFRVFRQLVRGADSPVVDHFCKQLAGRAAKAKTRLSDGPKPNV